MATVTRTEHCKPPRALLLLGPTGSGKSPLGDWLDAHGLWRRRCHHFDFGAHLRAAVAGGPGFGFAPDEIAFLETLLRRGALLENDSLHLAARILDRFIAERGLRPDHWLVLNGLPRHVGQAEALVTKVRVQVVIELECDAAVVRQRLSANAGGDRSGRIDDELELVSRKLATYHERIRPLGAHYRERGVRILRVPVGLDTGPEAIAAVLERSSPPPNAEAQRSRTNTEKSVGK